MRWCTLFLAVLVGCKGTAKSSVRAVNPLKMAARVKLPQPRPMVVATFTVTEKGYEVRSLLETMGTAAPASRTENAVRITALDGAGRTVSVAEVANPRVIRTAGPRNPQLVILPRTEFAVVLPRPRPVSSFRIQVRRGPGEEYDRTIAVSPKKIPR